MRTKTPTFDCNRCGETFDRADQNPWSAALFCTPCFRANKNEYRRRSETHQKTHREYQRDYMRRYRAAKRAEREAQSD